MTKVLTSMLLLGLLGCGAPAQNLPEVDANAQRWRAELNQVGATLNAAAATYRTLCTPETAALPGVFDVCTTFHRAYSVMRLAYTLAQRTVDRYYAAGLLADEVQAIVSHAAADVAELEQLLNAIAAQLHNATGAEETGSSTAPPDGAIAK